jgi:hypothetical protein
MMNVQAPENGQIILKKFENSSMKTVAEQSMSLQMPLESVIEFAVDLDRKFQHVPHCSFIITMHLLTHP